MDVFEAWRHLSGHGLTLGEEIRPGTYLIRYEDGPVATLNLRTGEIVPRGDYGSRMFDDPSFVGDLEEHGFDVQPAVAKSVFA